MHSTHATRILWLRGILNNPEYTYSYATHSLQQCKVAFDSNAASKGAHISTLVASYCAGLGFSQYGVRSQQWRMGLRRKGATLSMLIRLDET